MMLIHCAICGKGFEHLSNHARKFCSDKCASKSYTERFFPRPKWRKSASTVTVGAVHEIQVAADLLRRGYHVFRSMSPACPCDLICMKEDICLRVEVTTGILTRKGEISHVKKYVPKTWDILALVVDDEIHYFPELEDSLT